MASILPPILAQAHDLVRRVLRPGDVAVDATVGNGQDTLFLAECVGPTGRVIGFDIQLSAIEATASRLRGRSWSRESTWFSGGTRRCPPGLTRLRCCSILGP